jgi:hypothetical protein
MIHIKPAQQQVQQYQLLESMKQRPCLRQTPKFQTHRRPVYSFQQSMYPLLLCLLTHDDIPPSTPRPVNQSPEHWSSKTHMYPYRANRHVNQKPELICRSLRRPQANINKKTFGHITFLELLIRIQPDNRLKDVLRGWQCTVWLFSNVSFYILTRLTVKHLSKNIGTRATPDPFFSNSACTIRTTYRFNVVLQADRNSAESLPSQQAFFLTRHSEMSLRELEASNHTTINLSSLSLITLTR